MHDSRQQLQGSDGQLSTQAWCVREDKRATVLLPGSFKPVVDDPDWPRSKPKGGGLWTSTYDPVHGSGWVQWCISEEFEVNDDRTFRLWTLEPDPAARVYTINSYEDLVRLCRRYGRTRTWGEDSAYGPYHDTYPDWSLVAEAYDAVHMTEGGQWKTRLSRPMNLYGWDCESTLWFRWAFTEVANLGVVACEQRRWEEAADAV